MLEIRQLDSNNIASAKKLIIDSLAEAGYEPDDYADDDLKDLLNGYNDNDDAFFILQEGSTVTGLLAFKDRGGGTGEIRRLCIQKHDRNEQIQELLLLRLLEYASNKSFRDIFCLIPHNTTWLIDFLKSHQFKVDDLASTNIDTYLTRAL